MENENKSLQENQSSDINQVGEPKVETNPVAPENVQPTIVEPAQNIDVQSQSVTPEVSPASITQNENANQTIEQNIAQETNPSVSSNQTIPQDITQISSGLESKDLEMPKKSNPALNVVMGILIFLVVVLAGLGGVYAYMHTDEYIVGSSIKSFNNIKDNYFPALNYNMEFKDKVTNEGTMTFKLETSYDEASMYSKILKDLKLNYKFVVSNNDILADVLMIKNNEELAGVKVLYQENKGYLYLKNIYDKYIDLEIEEEIEQTTTEELNLLVEVSLESLQTRFFEKELEKSEAEITIDGKKVKVIANKIEYTEEEILNLLNSVIADIKANEEANKVAQKVIEDFENYNLDEEIEDLDKEHMSIFSYIIYTDKLTSKTLGLDFKSIYYEETWRDYEECEAIEDFDEYYDCLYETIYVQTSSVISYRTGEKEIIEISEDEKLQGAYVISKDGDKTIITIKEYKEEKENELGKIEIYSKDNTMNILFEMKEDEEVLKVNYDLEITEIKANSEYEQAANIIINYTDGEDNIRLEVNANNTIKDSGEVNEKVTETVTFDNITEEDQTTIMTNLQTLLEKMGFEMEEEDPVYEVEPVEPVQGVVE